MNAFSPPHFPNVHLAIPAAVDDVSAGHAAKEEAAHVENTRDADRKYAAELITRIAGGDEAALAEFYDRFSASLYGLALRILRDEKEAEDALQEGLLYLWRKSATYREELSSPFAWAVMIVRNKAIDRLRSRTRSKQALERATVEFLHMQRFDADSANEPADRDQGVALRNALARLPAAQANAISLAFFAGLTHEEIADQLETPLGTVKTWIRRGLLRLRQQLADLQ